MFSWLNLFSLLLTPHVATTYDQYTNFMTFVSYVFCYMIMSKTVSINIAIMPNFNVKKSCSFLKSNSI